MRVVTANENYRGVINPPFSAMADGALIYLTAPSDFDIDFWHIANGLSKINRFNGQTGAPYSVAQHSVLVHDHLPDHLKLYGLLHDAHEAYTGDITTPMKAAIGWICPSGVDAIHEIQQRFDLAIWEAAGLSPLSGHANEYAVKEADKRAYVTESRLLRPGYKFDTDLQPFPVDYLPVLDWHEARDQFLSRLRQHGVVL